MEWNEWLNLHGGDRIMFSERCATSVNSLRELIGTVVTVSEIDDIGTYGRQVKIKEWRELNILKDYWYPREYFSTIEVDSPDFCGLSISDFI